MKHILIILSIFISLAASSQVVLAYKVSTITAMKNYTGAANQMRISSTGEVFDTCTNCTADETTVYSGTGGKKWKRVLSPIADNAATTRGMTIAAWGNSLTAGFANYGLVTTYPGYWKYLSDSSGYNVVNLGISGATSTQIKNGMIADVAKRTWNAVMFAVGRNNYTDTVTVKSDVDAMVTSLGHNRYIILGEINGAYTNEWSGTTNFSIISALNSFYARTYGDHYFDIRNYLLTKGTGTGQDAIDVGNGVIPASLRSDSLHLNADGYLAVAQAIRQKLYLFDTQDSLVTLKSLRGYRVATLPIHINTLYDYQIKGTQVINLPDQVKFNGSFFIGNTGATISHTTGTDGYYNTFAGLETGKSLTTSSSSTGFGYSALNKLTTGVNNTAFGYRSLVSATTAASNVAFGGETLNLTTTSGFNTAVGNFAGYFNTAANNSILGYQSLFWNSTGGNNVSVGYAAANSLAGGGNLSAPSSGTYVGTNTTGFSASESNAIVIGSNAIGQGSNSVVIGDNNISSTFLKGAVGIGITTTSTLQPIASSAQLDIRSTTKGFLPPRMTAVQAAAISSPAEGLIVYVTDTSVTFTAKGWWGYDGAAWQKLNN